MRQELFVLFLYSFHNKFFSIAALLMYLITPIACLAQETTYRVSWSNEVLLPFSDLDYPDLAPDGQKIVFIKYNKLSPPELGQLWIADSKGLNSKVLYTEEDLNITNTPRWSPDGKKIIFLKGSNFELWEVKPDGTNARSILERKSEKFNPIFSIDSSKVILGMFGIDDPGIYRIDFLAHSQKLIFSTKTCKNLNSPFAISPDNKMLSLLDGQNLIIINSDNGSILSNKNLKTSLKGAESPIWAPNGRFIIVGNLLYVISTGEEETFLPDNVIRYKEEGKPDFVGPESMTISRDGKKIAFVLTKPDIKSYLAKIKIMDIVWK